MNRMLYRRLVFVCCCLQLHAGHLYAQGVLPVNRYYNRNMPQLIWDATSGNNVINNISGNWDAGSLTWQTKNPPTNTTNIAWIQGSNAVFGGSPGTGAAGTVTVTVARQIRGLIFNPAASGNFTLAGTGPLNFAGGNMEANAAATIQTPISGTGNFYKTGSAALTLEGNNTGLSGNMTVSNGNLNINNNNGAGTTAIIMGDDNTGTSPVGWYWGGSLTPSNNITVTNKGTGNVTIGTFSAGTNTNHSGNISLNRDVTFYDGTSDRTSFAGIISGTGNITIDGLGTWNSTTGQVARVTFNNISNSFTGTVTINAGKALQLNGIVVINNQPIVCNGFLVLNAGTGYISTLTGNGTVEIHPTVGNQTLSIGNGNGSSTFSGTVRNGLGSAILSLQKDGTGTITLGGTNSYTGATTANTGILGFTAIPTSGTWNIAVSNTAPTTANSGRITLPNAPTFNTKIVNIVITETGTGISYQAISWTGTASILTPTLRVNGAGRLFGVPTNGTTVTYSTTGGITVSR